MTNEYELADESRDKLIFEKEDLLAPLRAGMIMPPHPMYPEMDENNYYRGEVTSAHPSQATSAHKANQIAEEFGEVK
jgi:NADH-quinone oxidoreductase subunit I